MQGTGNQKHFQKQSIPISMQPLGAVDSKSLLGLCAYAVDGVACVTLAVVTTPVDKPLISAISAIDKTFLPRKVEQSAYTTFSSTLITPAKRNKIRDNYQRPNNFQYFKTTFAQLATLQTHDTEGQFSLFCPPDPIRRNKIRDNGPYPSFHLKTRFWGQNDKNLNKFGVTTDILS